MAGAADAQLPQFRQVDGLVVDAACGAVGPDQQGHGSPAAVADAASPLTCFCRRMRRRGWSISMPSSTDCTAESWLLTCWRSERLSRTACGCTPLSACWAVCTSLSSSWLLPMLRV